MSKHPKVAAAIEEMILPVLPDAEVYWADGGQSAIVVDDSDGFPYFITVEPDFITGDVRTYSSKGDEWEMGWDA